MTSRARASSAPCAPRVWLEARPTEPWHKVCLDALERWSAEARASLDGRLALSAGALLALGAAGLSVSYLLFIESVLHFWLPFYAAASAYYWFLLWKQAGRQRIEQKSHGLLLSGYFCGELLLLVLLGRIQSSFLRQLCVHFVPLLGCGLAAVFGGQKCVLEASLAIYLVRLFCVRGFTLAPDALRPFFAYSACFAADMAAQLNTPKQVTFCDSVKPAPRVSQSLSEPGGHPARATRNRRTSLPACAGSILVNRQQSNLSEARGLLVDLMANRDLPSSVVSCLRAVNSLLSPQPALNLNLDLGLPQVVLDPYSGEEIVVSACLCLAMSNAAASLPRPRRITRQHTFDSATLGLNGLKTTASFEVDTFTTCSYCSRDFDCRCCPKCHHKPVKYQANKPRVTNITFSTVTSATGLPTIVAEPNRARSSSFWRQQSDEETPEKEPVGPRLSLEKSDSVQTVDGTSFDVAHLDENPSIERLQRWDFQIFDFAKEYPQTMLTRTAYTIFKHTDLLRVFKISAKKFLNFFHQLELGYWDIPYHNIMHATDVLHGCFYLTVHSNPLCGSAESDAPLKSAMSALELMALYTAAAMHDYDHPGRTNAFLVAVEDKKAILYNDRSVLENHHAASGWSLLQKTNNNFVESLDTAECKRFRYLVLEYILATDLKRHFEIIMDFNAKAKSDAFDVQDESDRMLINEMYIKMADINSPTKPQGLHRGWTDRIVQEFYAQGDEERRRCMPVSPYMNRSEPQVAKLQDSFIAHIVSPLAVALSEAEALPVLSGASDDESELIINLNDNHKFWKAKLGEDDPSLQNDNQEDQHEMETIEEQEDEEFC